ncbi:chemotaxis protein MotB [Duganella sp. 1224]|uniref:OmpA/MotB family protein n=1 Tax=Duganella sp. 1224 TaxID=2587052 RepID=UPI0015CB5C8E|nr:OmpA family protein [Duganella sp. 1224]NYE59966.1 chemotaxis protein MotB [Duganella sp. 1224]
MKDKPSEWIVIADLMSGVVAVVMLMLVVSLVQKQAAEQRLSEGADAQQQQIRTVLGQMEAAFQQEGAARYVAIDKAAGKVTLLEHAFRSGSACIEPAAKAAFAQVQDRIAAYLVEFQAGQIYVEGHTDDQKVKGPVTDLRNFCTVYDDNFTLSAARAREARLLLIGHTGAEAAKRVVVAGFGDSHPLPGLSPSNERNRRVELRFVNGAGH